MVVVNFYWFIHSWKKLSKKIIEENMKHKEKDEKKELKETKTNPYSKLKTYEKKKKCIKFFAFQN